MGSLDDYPRRLARTRLDLAVARSNTTRSTNQEQSAPPGIRVAGYPVLCTDILPYQGALPVTRVPQCHHDWVKAIAKWSPTATPAGKPAKPCVRPVLKD